MRQPSWLMLLLILAAPQASFAAAKDNEPPDKEMLRLMDFLRDMEMIKQAEMMQDLAQVEAVGNPISDKAVRKPAPTKRKEATQ
jgi:hypothetical protein